MAQPIETDILKVSVIDNGMGISNDEKNLVFEKYTQIITQNSGNTRSTGLGLAFCKLAVEALGGTIGVDAKAAGGTIFWFTLPLLKEVADKTELKKPELDKNQDKISDDLRIILSPYFAQLKLLKVFEVSKIQQIISKIKALQIKEFDSITQALENAAYSVNQEEFDRLLKKINQI